MNKTKNSIFKSALLIFSKNGYNGATMDEIALNAKVAKGTLYYHFKSKEEIFRYVISEGMNVIRGEMEEEAGKESNPINKLKAVCRVQIELIFRNREFFKVLMSQLWGQESRQLELRNVIKDYIGIIEKYLKEAMENGYIKNGETEFMSYIFFGVLCSGAVYDLINNNEESMEKLTEKITRYVFKGMNIT
ncbi:TetR/AcrR family transcriptional regulator [Clostridium felsineum]|uniref:Fatty acid metabolism regulator protein n=1 Tax=Clostridium felsineum TaxID=36839 RepID=A0A1S8LDS3_9CLOT|nr:TetR/AcrR family transcriptional regulator [Clostridium felsineum]MCR3758875.1 TetR/AcrR family transcriptional regulator [Clostridium felsineum]URZ08933.1 Fatty acid metabolism regulator protein [Clostridium felsineum]URZ09561.1 Fatty acid metabolism regulator protein [Clostridium felsineum]URZ14085.1 Fatty acid metabolism regulator protein [Clostridium felsineum DSM 794]